VHLQLVARVPRLAWTGTELARRQNSLAITLFNSRRPGSSRITLCAPDGPGTIPGGAPGMQTPDFWSVPFAPVATVDAPPLFGEVLAGLVGHGSTNDAPSQSGPIQSGPIQSGPIVFDEAFGPWLSDHLDQRWLPIAEQVRAGVALGLVDPAAIAAEAGTSVGDVITTLALEDAIVHGVD
jgi:hypothetical protein